MTLIKSLLLGSAAGIVAVATAQAADLPTRKAAPVEYVKVCNVGGITGWVMPGSDTCMKISGYITSQFTGGNLNTQYNWASTSVYTAVTGISLPTGVNYSLPSLLVQASPAQRNTTFFRPDTGWSVRANIGFDFASNTAYGPLIGHMDLNTDVGNGFDALGGDTYLNTGYLTWAGITAGKAQSFYSFVGGGENWANFFSPDRKGFNEPILLAYTASFGGGFSATLSAESPGPVGGSGGGSDMGYPNRGTLGSNPLNITFGGQRWPDIVGALHVKQGWGEAQISGVVHDVNVVDNAFYNTSSCFSAFTSSFTAPCNGQKTQTGWGIDAGVKVNLPSFGAGDNFILTGSYTQSAVLYSGLVDGMWGEGGQVNGNGQPMYLADAFFNPLTNQWAKPTAWSIAASLEHHFTPEFYINPEASVGQIKWSNQGGCGFAAVATGLCGLNNLGGPLSPSATSWIIGADIGWNPVTNLNFDLELMYQDTNQTKPNGVVGTVYNLGGPGGSVFVPGAWQDNSSGCAGRFRITRYF